MWFVSCCLLNGVCCVVSLLIVGRCAFVVVCCLLCVVDCCALCVVCCVLCGMLVFVVVY